MRWFPGFVLVICLASGSLAQLASTTSLVGDVVDSHGGALADVEIVAMNVASGETFATHSNQDGHYSIPFLKIGTYTITARQTKFATVTETGVTLATNQVVRADFQLNVGVVKEKISVTATAAPLSTDDATIDEVISQKAVDDLPLNGRDTLTLATLVASVLPGFKAPANNPGGGEDFIAAGAREVQNSVSLDGVSIMNNLISTTSFRPSVDAVEEVQVQTGTYPPLYGGYLGLQMNLVTKRGSNSFHGAAFEFVRNNDLDARGYFEQRSKPQPPYHQNQFGASFGGPLRIPKFYNGKNRTFFFADFEELRQSQSVAQTDTVLTARMRQGDFGELASPVDNPFAHGSPFENNVIPSTLLSPIAMRALQYMPLPNLPGLANNYLAEVASSNRSHQSLGRLDHDFSDKARLFFRIAWADTQLINGNTNPFNGYDQPVNDRNFVGGYTEVLSNRLTNDLRFGHQVTTTDSVNFFSTPALAGAGTALGIPGFTTNALNPGLPELAIAGYMPIGGQNMVNSNWHETDETWQGTDVLNYTHGADQITGGVEIRRLETLRTANNTPRGVFSFTSVFSGNAAADFMLGLPQQVTTPGALYPGGAAEYRDGFFLMDKWQVHPRVTLSLGLRYELPTVPESTNGNGTILDPTQTYFIPAHVPTKIPYIEPTHQDFAPRFGLAYRVTDAWVVRGGFGIYYNPNQLNTFTLATTNPPFSTVYTYNSSAADLLNLSNPISPAAQGASAAPNAFTINPHLPTAYMNQWSLDLERALWSRAALDIQYVGSHTLHLDRSYYDNTPLPGPGAISARRPNPLFGQIRMIQNDEIANYEGLNVVVRQNLRRRLSMLLSYTWSHALDVSTDSNAGTPMNPYDWRADYGNSNWDVRHRFVGSYTYAFAYFEKDSNPALRNVLGHWQANGIVRAQTGFPFTVTIPVDQANTGASGQRPDLVMPPHADCGQGHLTNCISVSAFALPERFTYGDAGRNLLRGPDLVNVDFSLFKNILIRERTTFQFRTEFFNLFNHPSFANPVASLVLLPNSQAFSTASNFGSITSTSNNSRLIQLAAKLTF